MIREFLRYSKSFFKHKLFRLIIYGFIAFIIFTFVKIKGVNASAISGVIADIYAQSSNCSFDDSTNNFNCIKGRSYKMSYIPNSAGDNNLPVIIDNENNSVLIRNIIFDYKFNATKEVTNNDRSYMISYGAGDVLDSNTASASDYNFSLNVFPITTQNSNDDVDPRYNLIANYNFKPYYCSYFDVDENQFQNCNIILAKSNNSFIWFVIDLPIGTKFNEIKLYFGTPNLTGTYSFKNMTTGFKAPNFNEFFYNTDVAGNTSFNYYKVNYSTWRTTTPTNNVGLVWYPAGYNVSFPVLTKNSLNGEVQVDSTSYTNNLYKFNFDNVDSTLKNQYNETTNNIDQELTQEDNWFSDSMNDFIDSGTSSSFSNLFSSLFQYPLEKLNESITEPLFDNSPTNNKGTGGLNLAVCTGRGFIGDVSEDRIQIPTINGVKWNIPCLHYDVYSQLHNETTGFYPTSVDSHSIQSGRSTNFYSLYRIILRGVLVYLLFLNILDIYRYLMDSDRKEIDVIDL